MGETGDDSVFQSYITPVFFSLSSFEQALLASRAANCVNTAHKYKSFVLDIAGGIIIGQSWGIKS